MIMDTLSSFACILVTLSHLYATPSSQYALIRLDKNWTDAELFCQRTCNSHLASIHSTEDFDAISSLAITYRDSTWSWIGLMDIDGKNNFQWVDNSSFDYGSTLFATPWAPTEPNNSPRNATCTETHFDPVEWYDYECNFTQTFICNSCNYVNYINLSTYYLSPNRFKYNNAQTYCEKHCHSDLASIHNEIDMQIARNGALNGVRFPGNSAQDSVHIGLSGTYFSLSWLDNTVFNYGSQDAAYPWSDYEWFTDNGNNKCVILDPIFDYKWDDHYSYCTTYTSRFLCNSCDGELNKYIIYHATTNAQYNVAQSYCKTHLGTSLASIHSWADYNATQDLCRLANNDGQSDNCFIGLGDTGNPGTFTWIDESDFNFGNDLQNTDIWVTGVTGTGNYIQIDINNDYKWNIAQPRNYFICNAPSLFCENCLYWKNVVGLWTHESDKMYTNGTLLQNVIVSDVQWINKNGIISIEYMFKVNNAFGNVFLDQNTGILLFNFDSICNYYHIGISVTKNTVFLAQNLNGIYILLKEVSFTVELDHFYVLSLKITDGINIAVSINDENMFIYVDNESINYIINGISSGYIGLITSNVNVYAQYLYISGSIWKPNDNDIIYEYNSCSSALTFIPTGNPTVNPTFTTTNPTSNPTLEPTIITIDPTINPTFMPSVNPTKIPTTITSNPTKNPSQNSSEKPTENPSKIPSQSPSANPTQNPTKNPSKIPTQNPSKIPSQNPTKNPSFIPSKYPSEIPSKNPSFIPSKYPSKSMHSTPTLKPNIDGCVDCHYSTDVMDVSMTIYDNNELEHGSTNNLLIPILSVIACICIIILLGLIIFIYMKRKRATNKINQHIISLPSTSSPSVHPYDTKTNKRITNSNIYNATSTIPISPFSTMIHSVSTTEMSKMQPIHVLSLTQGSEFVDGDGTLTIPTVGTEGLSNTVTDTPQNNIITAGNYSNDEMEHENIGNGEFIIQGDDEIIQSVMTPS